MRLSKIKLSGFKSFVDPTTLVVPCNLVGIVGPNGCGKSNIIDAVTWVMGESSAKHLRGEALTDVIFNGSSARQPVGQAMVELVFDNSEGKAGGQYASYNEISIKRQINREGISVYYLNGSRCRRKDIHGLFLGTGLGPRGYSIIEQGTISRLIEAKPDELRVFIEEAAGISKYREKRRETENRMSHTRENLDRLNDIREELGKQLGHLQRQAKAAERYQLLKQQERQLKAELMALNYRDLETEIRLRQDKVGRQETEVEQSLAGLRHIEAAIETRREDLSSANDAFNQVQSDYYQVGGDISQIEQKIEYSNERIASLKEDVARVEQAIAATSEQHANDQEKLKSLSLKMQELEPALQGSRSDSSRAYDSLSQAEQAMQKWQDEWDAFKEAEAGFRRQVEVYQTRMHHLEDGLHDIGRRRQTLSGELESLAGEELDGQLGEFEARVAFGVSELDASRDALEQRLTRVRECRDRAHALNERLAEQRTRQQKTDGKLAALTSLQQASGNAGQAAMDQWLSTLGEDRPPRLLEAVDVEPEWTHALETVLGRRLQSVVVKDFRSALAALDTLAPGDLDLIARDGGTAGGNRTGDSPRLLDKVSYDGNSLDGLLGGVVLAGDIAEALAIHPRLDPTESVVTRDGVWIGNGWIRVDRTSPEESVLLREQEIQRLKVENDALLEDIAALQRNLAAARTELEKAEEDQHAAQQELSEHQEQLTSVQAGHAEIRARRQQSVARKEQIGDELDALEEREDAGRGELEGLRKSIDRAGEDQASLACEKEKLVELRKKHQDLLDAARSNWQSTHEHSHEIALQLESLSSHKASLEQAIKRNEIQMNNLTGNLEDLRRNLQQVSEPLADLRGRLDAKLAVRLEVEKQLNESRQLVQSIEAYIREKDQERVTAEQEVDARRSLLEQLKMDTQEVRVRLQTVKEQLQGEDHQVGQILEQVEEGANKQDWQEKIQSTEQKIQRLGPINLAAIDEYTKLSDRKQYLDRQNGDLTEALETLENAIRKIDKETRTRFKETFDLLNANLKDMFPVLFGGGHAFLEMTGADLLDTGVAIMARPPGKKNSSIHLLSGGEKALTAVALVFAIFKLNPAPFCILDEVDAPLDDTNAGRFSDLLAKMSTDVQFLVITHNKITMEIAQQLLGVTMHEPGVSRLVSVDMEEAVQMAASA